MLTTGNHISSSLPVFYYVKNTVLQSILHTICLRKSLYHPAIKAFLSCGTGFFMMRKSLSCVMKKPVSHYHNTHIPVLRQAKH